MNRQTWYTRLEHICAAALLLLALLFSVLVYGSEMEREEKALCFVCTALMVLASVLFWLILRRQVLVFSQSVCAYVDTLAGGEIPQIHPDEDTLTSKIQMKLDKLSDITYSAAARQEGQKQEIQRMVSDISHQLKTPIANLTMYSSMLENEGLDAAQRAKFLRAITSQAEKLEFLVEALAKMSRLESRLISLDVKPGRIYDTLAHVMMQVSASAERKHILLTADCEEGLIVPHDAKWTVEALFNIVDNAVKYTPEGGKVSIRVQPWELFTRIEIEDTGIGIAKEHYEDVFKRFYRESKVHQQDGVGIGLYLSREIVSQQGGYIQVRSKENTGTVFSVFLPNQDEND